MAQKTYYTLLTRETKTDDWSIHFGDYYRDVVNDERDDVKQSATRMFPVQTKIITTGDKQAEIQHAVDELNAKGK